MSVKFHEAVSFDSTKYRLDYREDFWGDSLDARWDLTVVGGGSGTVVDSQDGGVYRLATGAVTADSAQLDWQDYRSLHVNKKVTMEIRAKLSDATYNTTIIALQENTNNWVMFYLNTGSASTTWTLWTRNDGASTNPSSGITADADYHIFRIETFPTGEVHFYIDGVECANSPLTTNIPDDAGDYLQPRIFIDANTTSNRTLDIDYIYVRQER